MARAADKALNDVVLRKSGKLYDHPTARSGSRISSNPSSDTNRRESNGDTTSTGSTTTSSGEIKAREALNESRSIFKIGMKAALPTAMQQQQRQAHSTA